MSPVVTKVLAMLSLGLGSLISGMLPAFFSKNVRDRFPLLISSLLCFGAGVLLATSLVHMLPEARENLPNYSELALCAGFFLVYFVDELVHAFYGERLDRPDKEPLIVDDATTFHNTITGSEDCLVKSNKSIHSYGTIAGPHSHNTHQHFNEQIQEELGGTSTTCGGAEQNPRMCHVSHDEPCNKSSTGQIGLLTALLLHSILEGLAIGLQETVSKVLLLLGAVASHKFVVGFCLGIELTESCRGKFSRHLVSIVIFSLGSVVGIGIGIGLGEVNETWMSTMVPVMQALAGGTLLYVTVSEVLPRERARWHQKPVKIAGIVQFFSVASGFIVMYVLNVMFDHDSDGP